MKVLMLVTGGCRTRHDWGKDEKHQASRSSEIWASFRPSPFLCQATACWVVKELLYWDSNTGQRNWNSTQLDVSVDTAVLCCAVLCVTFALHSTAIIFLASGLHSNNSLFKSYPRCFVWVTNQQRVFAVPMSFLLFALINNVCLLSRCLSFFWYHLYCRSSFLQQSNKLLHALHLRLFTILQLQGRDVH